MIIKQSRIIKSKIFNAVMEQINPATEETLLNLLSQNDILTSQLLSGIVGVPSKTIYDLFTRLSDTSQKTQILNDVLSTINPATEETLSTMVSSLQDVNGSGSLDALNEAVTLTNLHGKNSLAIDVSGTFTAKLLCEASVDGTTYLQLTLFESRYMTPFDGAIKAAGQFHADISGYRDVRIRISNYTVGTAVVTILASSAKMNPELQGDLWQRYVQAGRAFQTTSNLITVTGSAETDFFLLKNISGSEKTIRLNEIFLNIGLASGVQSLKSTFRLYRNATITANGNALTIFKTNPSGAHTAIAETYTAPTISARGSLIQVFPFTQGIYLRDLNLTRYVLDGGNLLITVHPATTNTEHSISSSWAEVEA